MVNIMMMRVKKLKLAIIGLGYVGLPLAVEFAKKRLVIGFDINKKRIKQLTLGYDSTLEVSKNKLNSSKKLILSSNTKTLHKANCYIITVPTPINKLKKPDLKPLLLATKTVGKVLSKGNLVIYESTVYPGCTEEKCVPLLEKESGLKFNKDFFCGYSPERINPGDKKHRIDNVKKITSGSNIKAANLVDRLYKEIVNAGTHKAPSIKVAEAAKVIENTQRDLNIALINELSILFGKMNIDTADVLNAAKTKWNFIAFNPGLVGGHCIGVDPYYLTYKAREIGYNPEIILAGRKLNDNMSIFVASEFIKSLKNKLNKIKKAKILVMGLTFKENCPDLRNSGVSNLIKQLKKYKLKIDLYDPWANKEMVKNIYKKFPINKLKFNKYDGIIIAVAHKKFNKMGVEFISNLGKKNHVLYDLKSMFNTSKSDLRL
tara:strand:- start:1535 stop:2827 length:1293 start_codon:yes stop_codon:yes gene_type:complete